MTVYLLASYKLQSNFIEYKFGLCWAVREAIKDLEKAGRLTHDKVAALDPYVSSFNSFPEVDRFKPKGVIGMYWFDIANRDLRVDILHNAVLSVYDSWFVRARAAVQSVKIIYLINRERKRTIKRTMHESKDGQCEG